MSNEFLSPLDSSKYIGTVGEVYPNEVIINLPFAVNSDGQYVYGEKLNLGVVGEYVLIDCGDIIILSRVLNIKMSNTDKQSIEPEYKSKKNTHPLGKVQLLSSLNLSDLDVIKGIIKYPVIGNKVYAASPKQLKYFFEFDKNKVVGSSVRLNLGTIGDSSAFDIHLKPESLFGRHCAILGTTGGGKSWTISKILEESKKYNSKILLIDATGEFEKFDTDVQTIVLKLAEKKKSVKEEVCLPYTKLEIEDLFSLFNPSPGVHYPKLREAIKTLKVVECAKKNAIFQNGNYNKGANQSSKLIFDKLVSDFYELVNDEYCNFDINKLSEQIKNECITFSGVDRWGGPNTNDLSMCSSIIHRIENLIHSSEFNCIFSIKNKISVFDEINKFLNEDKKILVISLKSTSSISNLKAILINSLGRFLLTKARSDDFKNKPLLIFLDEAHQYLNKSIGDDYNRKYLNQFELIAKEGRKFCLNVCFATQRPRDLPDGILSQVGSMIVHRLINEADRKIVEQASSDMDKDASLFLPSLSPGQAILVGVDLPLPFAIKIKEPVIKPNSSGSDFQKCWKVV